MQICDAQLRRGRGPCLHPDAILCANEGAVLHIYPLHILFSCRSAKASNANTVAWPTSYILDVNSFGLIAHRDTIISRFYDGIRDIDICGTRYMDTISVWTISWGWNCESDERHVVARYTVYMEILAIFGGHIMNYGVVDEIEAQVLH